MSADSKSDGQDESSDVERRQFVKAAGTVGAVGLTGLAGCTTGGGDDGGDGGDDGGDGGGGDDGGDDSGGGGSGPITFGQPALLSGDLQSIQPPVSASTDMAIQKINEAGGPLGREIEVIRRDTGRDPAEGRSVMEAFIEQDGAVAIHGFTSTVVQPNWEFFQDQAVPIVSMYSGTAFLDSRGGDGGTPEDLSDDEWFWRTTGADSQHTAGAAIHAARSMEGDSVTIGAIHAKTAGSTEWAEAFAAGAQVIDGVEWAGLAPVDGGQSSYRSDLDSFFEDDVDIMGVAMGVPSATTLLRNWDDGGYGGNVLLSNPLRNQNLVENVGGLADDAAGWVRVSVPAIAGPWGDDYIEELGNFVGSGDNDYASDLTRNNWSASAYDAITVTALAIQRAGEASHDAIQQNLGPVARPPGTKVQTFAEGKEALENGDEINFNGAQTNVDFNEFGDVFNRADVLELGSGGFEKVDEVTGDRISENIAAQREAN